MPKLIVATYPGVERPATKREVCQHIMVPTNASCGGKVYRRWINDCGHTDAVPREATGYRPFA